jgi:hypothetical protein
MSELNSNLKEYILNTVPIDLNSLEIRKERLNGLSNDVFLISVFHLNNLVSQFVFRLFGCNHKQVDNELESYIIEKLSNVGLTPKILSTDRVTYSIEEYIHAKHPESAILLQPKMLGTIADVLLNYSKFSPVYYFFSYGDKLNGMTKLLLFNEVDYEYKFKSNMFDKILYQAYPAAWDHLMTVMNGNYGDLTNSKLYRLKEFLQDFKSYFLTVFPKSSLLVLNHNDIHRLNILQNDNLILLDHEYACLNLIGNDIVNYLIETCWDYTLDKYPFYTYKIENLDFDLFYKIYTDYLEKFEKATSMSEYFKRVYKQGYTFTQMLRIMCIISCCWILQPIQFLTVQSMEDKSVFDTLGSAIHRLEMFEICYQQLNKQNKNLI